MAENAELSQKTLDTFERLKETHYKQILEQKE